MKKSSVLLGILLILMLNGCASLDNYIEKRVKEESGILEEVNYVNYQSKVASGNINEEGFYYQKAEESERTGSIHVTFASNSKLDVKYFEDANKSVVVDTSSCYLNPGDCIYAQVDISSDVNIYDFSEFEIYEYDVNGDKQIKPDMSSDFTETGIAVQIPDDYAGAEISIVPVGKYQLREIFLKDYYTDNNMEHNLTRCAT